jgi:hypothetical protein
MTYRPVAATVLLLVSPVLALDGQPGGIHDPSTVVMHGSRYYTYGTGAGLPVLVSDDGWTSAMVFMASRPMYSGTMDSGDPLTFASWNQIQIGDLLRRLEAIRRAAGAA